MADFSKFKLSQNGGIVYFKDGTKKYAIKSIGGFYILSGFDEDGSPEPPPNPDVNTDPITIVNCEGESLEISGTRMTRAVGIYQEGTKLSISDALRRRAIIAAFMTTAVESKFLLLANSNVPESLNYPNDGVGSDNDSLGLFQQRPASGWGTVAQLMDASYNARAFYGGNSGPNRGNPPGLLDKNGWESGDLGTWCQRVQVSSFPDRYQCWEAAATELYVHMTKDTGGGGSSEYRWPFPLSEVTSEFRPPGRPTHDGMDFSGPTSSATGSPIPAAHAGTVQVFTNHPGFGNGANVVADDGTYTRYAHMYAPPSVEAGQRVEVGDILGGVGNTGNSFGNHLHFETRLPNHTAVNPRTFMRDRNATEP